MRLKRRVFKVVGVVHPDDRITRVFEFFILSLIALNVAAFIVQTVKSVYSASPVAFQSFEFASVAVFTIEYVLRVWSCTVSPGYAGAIRGRLRFMLTPLAIIDLVAILPFYLPLASTNLLFLRSVRLFRFLRIAKAARYSKALQAFGAVISRKKEQLVVAFVLLSLALVFASSVMYFAESEAQPEYFSSIPAAMWWALETLTTVGYGDVYPVTTLGKLVASAVAILGIGVFALPTAIIGSGFVEEFQERHSRQGICPHCGKGIPRRS